MFVTFYIYMCEQLIKNDFSSRSISLEQETTPIRVTAESTSHSIGAKCFWNTMFALIPHILECGI